MYKMKDIRLLTIIIASSYAAGIAFTQSVTYSSLVYAQDSPVKVEIAKGSSDQSNGQFFVPSEISVSTGRQVIWTNADTTIHTVVQGSPSNSSSSSQPEFESDFIKAGETFDHTFTASGSFDYYCTLHPWMTGKVTVS